ncbi:MAG: c-type cytochrome [Thiobacillaceae bacterium]
MLSKLVGWLLASRWRVALLALVVLAVLDLGRSWNARVGYAQPVERWQSDPRVYADLTWPPGMGLPPGTPLGARVYAQRCAVCHGPDGRGNGPAAPSLIPRPRGFTLGEFKYKSTPAGEAPTDADLIKVVADGLPASSMPYWHDLLTKAEIRAVVDCIKSMSPVSNQGRQRRWCRRQPSRRIVRALHAAGSRTRGAAASAVMAPTAAADLNSKI